MIAKSPGAEQVQRIGRCDHRGGSGSAPARHEGPRAVKKGGGREGTGTKAPPKGAGQKGATPGEEGAAAEKKARR